MSRLVNRVALALFLFAIPAAIILMQNRKPDDASGEVRGAARDKALVSLRGSLRDPDSAKFTDVKVFGVDDLSVCGFVNSKNAFGGYTGSQRFLVTESTGLVWLEEMGQGETGKVLWSTCHDLGKSPDH